MEPESKSQAPRPRVPRLAITPRYKPGRYLVLDPAVFNVLEWWQEIEAAADLVTFSLDEARQQARAFSGIDPESRRQIQYHLENGILRLFAFRDKIALLLHQRFTDVPDERGRQPSYYDVLRDLGCTNADVCAILEQYQGPDADALYAIRNALAHRIGPAFGRSSFRAVKTSDGVHDIQSWGPYPVRYLEHLAVRVWGQFCERTRDLAELVQWDIVSPQVTERVNCYDAADAFHVGIVEDVAGGTMKVKCMRECRG